MSQIADALLRALARVGWQGRKKAPPKPMAKRERKAESRQSEPVGEIQVRCPIHNLPKPCPQCKSTFALAIAQRTLQRRQEQIEAHKKWKRDTWKS